MQLPVKEEMSFALFVALWNRCQGQQTPAVHLRLCSWLERKWHNPEERKWLLMAFRSCGKSTLVGLFCVWLLWRNPDLRILVLAADLALARKMVRNVKRIIEKHPLTQHLVPTHPDQWGTERFTIRRGMELRDPSMLAKSITTNITGTRADVIICDDVEVPKTCDGVTKREQMRERLRELDFILTPGGVQLYVGTPHNWYTIYAAEPRTEIGEEVAFLGGFSRLVIPILDQNNESAWPERVPLEEIEKIRLKTGPNNFASQMLCQPMSFADGRLDATALQVYGDELEYTEAGKQPVLSIGGVRMVTASAWWDPSYGSEKGDSSIVAVVYSDREGNRYLHHVAEVVFDAQNEKDSATQQCEQVADLIKRFYLPQLGVEKNGLGTFLPGLLRNAIAREGLVCALIEKSSTRAKNQRILEAFDALMAAKKLFIHESVRKSHLLREMQDWKPGKTTGKDDALDAAAGALEMDHARITRIYGTKRQGWTGGSAGTMAKADFNVLE
jgi:hypothetical protein